MRRRTIIRSLGIAAFALAAIQFVPVDRSNPPVQTEVEAPDDVLRVLRHSCFDCHSNETRWPWYGYVAPASWFLARHIHEARGDLNFSEWPLYDFEEAEHALHEIDEQIRKGKMPLWSYTLIHRDARLTPGDRNVLLRWAGGDGK